MVDPTLTTVPAVLARMPELAFMYPSLTMSDASVHAVAAAKRSFNAGAAGNAGNAGGAAADEADQRRAADVASAAEAIATVLEFWFTVDWMLRRVRALADARVRVARPASEGDNGASGNDDPVWGTLLSGIRQIQPAMAVATAVLHERAAALFGPERFAKFHRVKVEVAM
jgi:hypothetical protein